LAGLISLRGKGSFLRLFGSSIVSQAVLSAASLLVGLILIRRQSDVQYGYYVLVTVTLLLLSGIQSAFIQPSMVVRLARFDGPDRRALIGGLFREQRRFLLIAGAIAAVATGGLWAFGVLDLALTLLILAAILAAIAAMNREFFRMVLLAYRRPLEVLACDAIYVVLLVCGAYAATFSPLPAATAVLTLSAAAAVGGGLLARALWRHESWKIDGARHIVREIAPLGAWSVSGAGIHWAFSQGYTYLVAAMLDVQSVAAIAATRLLLMPVNLLSTGISQMMLPTASRWLHQHGAVKLHRRLLLFSAVLTALVLCYFGLMWVLRDWVFTHILKKQFAGRDTLLLLWSLVFLSMMLRDQLAHLLVVRGRMRQMSTLTLACATLALIASYLAIRRFGSSGALIGILVGEVLNVLGIAILTQLESRRPNPEANTGSGSG
jgi:O-antigen/teichoic acid export membrane protein